MTEKNYFSAETIEQTNLLTDPFGLTILSTLEADCYLTCQEIKEKTGEDLKLIEEYIDLFLKEDMIFAKKENDKMIYAKKADYYSFSPELLSMIPEQIQDHIIFGLLHSIQGDYYDLLKLAKNYKNLDKALETAGYPESKKSLDLIMSRIYIKEDQIDELEEQIKEIFKKYEKIPEDGKEDDYLTFDLNFFMKPTISNFIKKMKDK